MFLQSVGAVMLLLGVVLFFITKQEDYYITIARRFKVRSGSPAATWLMIWTYGSVFITVVFELWRLFSSGLNWAEGWQIRYVPLTIFVFVVIGIVAYIFTVTIGDVDYLFWMQIPAGTIGSTLFHVYRVLCTYAFTFVSIIIVIGVGFGLWN